MFSSTTRQSNHPNRRHKISKFRHTQPWVIAAVVCAISIVSTYVAFASISLSTSVPYTQTFDGMGIPVATLGPSTLPADFRIDQIVAPRTLGTFSAASTQTTRAAGANMSTVATGTYNFGSGTSTLGGADRAVGFMATATQGGNIYSELINNTGTDLTALQISYNVEKYKKGTNPAGFRFQLFYSSDGINWTSAGPNFLTSFAADADNNGYANAPGATVAVNNTLDVTVPNSTKIYLAWNYSVTSGNTSANPQALGIDNVSILGVQPTNPTGLGNANPDSVISGNNTFLTVAVTPGSNPTSVNHTVTVDTSSIGGNSSQPLFDDGSHGDVTPNDNLFSSKVNVATGTTGGLKTLPFIVTELGSLGRVGNGSIELTVLGSTNPSGSGAANPNSMLPGENSVLTVTVTPGTNPISTTFSVAADLSSIGGAANQQFFNDGVSGGDAVAGDNVFTYTATVAENTSAGAKAIPFLITDDKERSANGSIALTVQQPPPPPDHIVISQLYGGGGDSNAAFTNDYVELYNPTGNAFNLAGWSLQYSSATGSSWTTKQPLGGTIAPGEYFLVELGSGGVIGNTLPAANIAGDINISSTSGKLALVSNSINLNGACPNGSDPNIVDFVGYGSSANCFEGSDNAPAPSNTTAILRKFNGAQDTNQNNADFKAGVPNPRRTAPIVELGPWVTGTEPIADGTNAPYDSTIDVEFSEPVDVVGSWYGITCTASGQHNSATVAPYDNFKGYHITPNQSFQFGEQCTVTINHQQVHDQDADDSNPNTDTLFDDYVWTFSVVGPNLTPPPYPSSVHLTFGNPSNADGSQPNNYLMEKPTYSLSYNRDKGTPNWVSWHLEQDWFGNLARVDTFRADPSVPADWYRVQSTDYSSSGFERGQMTPNADRNNENRVPINQETYLMTNMVPQAPDNQGPWANMENDLRTMLNGTQNEMYIVSGPLGVGGTGANGQANTIANGHITVPEFTWKVVLVLPRGEADISRVTAATQTIAVLIPNVQGIRNNDWHMYLTTVDNIEALTGYDFFANLPDNVENAIEAGTNGSNPAGTADQFATVAEDVAGQLTIDAVSPLANPTFSSQIISSPTHGVLSGSGLTLTYTPAPDYHGTDSFTFRVNDGANNSNVSTMSITVTEVNDPPVANDDSLVAVEDTTLNISATDLSQNDLAGPPNESLQALSVTQVNATADTHGSVSLSNGMVSYSPEANYHGPASFTYQVCDNGTTNGAPDSKCAPATVNITVNSVNDNPVAVDDSATTDEDNSVLVDVVANDTDVDGDGRTLQSVGSAAHGTVSMVSGQAQYSPNLNFNGTDSFTYVVSDGHGGTATGTVNVTVKPVNDAPSASGQSVSTNGNTVVGIALVANDLETATANLNFVITAVPSHGSLTGSGANRTYTPALNYSGTDTFRFTVTDTGDGSSAALTSNEATVSITVNDTINPTVTAPANLNLGTGANANGCSLFISDATLGTANANDNSGVVSIDRMGVPVGNIFPVGTTTITYKATDGAGNTTQTTQTVTVFDDTRPTITAPAPVTVTANGNGQASVPNFVAGTVASDNCGNVTISQNPGAGTLVGVGVHTITLTATDSAGNFQSATTTFSVNPASGGGLQFALSVSPATARRNTTVKLNVAYSNNTGARQWVSFSVRYVGPCGAGELDNIGPIPIKNGAEENRNIPFHIPRTACTGVYELTLDYSTNGHIVGTTTAQLTVTP